MTFPVFASGDVLNASDMNAVGLWLVKTQTIGSAVSSVTVTGAFSADYDNYFLTVSGGAGSVAAGAGWNLTLGSTATDYYFGMNFVTYAGVQALINGNNTTSITDSFFASTNGLNWQMVIKNPFAAARTFFNWQTSMAATATNNLMTQGGGYLNNATSYTAFTLTAVSGTATGGTIRVYGYRN